ncbi:shikimate kinase [Salipaludibacillus neizhouensis]|uniref:Shikimate kinase n=1 Tax=Salipaludibacillus neizhouensis TaxID=885475 RepID=A0A3A9K1P2_9BACI|nr:AAA family ATPase [Salipaludibacillus neizhouensis]RKL66637.1 shikimate kinase [Salipaludibacillus neizhouensis]
MNFILIFGPQAVGKMTVGQEVEKLTELKLFHNHMTIDMLYPLFGFGPETWRLSTLFRQEIFKEVASSNMAGLIFTFVWAFDEKEDWDFVNSICDIFESKEGSVYFVELEADIEERLVRNKSHHRLEHKPTKRDIEQSEYNLKITMENHRLNSMEGEITRENYIKINNTHLSPEDVASIITDRFQI